MVSSKKKNNQRTASRSRSVKPEPRRGIFARYVRGALGLLFFLGIFAAIGSLFMHVRVVQQLKNQALASASMVVARPTPITPSVRYASLKLTQRLKRLGYRSVSSTPSRAGEFKISKHEVLLFVKESWINHNTTQHQQLVRIKIDAQGKISEITDVKFARPLKVVWLEPEFLSLLGQTSTRASTPKLLSEFSPQLVEAVLAIEDERFYSHLGLDPLAILRAAVVNLKNGYIVQGASTITQQLAKNLFLDSKRTFARKAVEAFAAILIEIAFTKDEILEFYLNEVFLGQEGSVAIHGFGEASLSFFNKDAADLSLEEAALLAGIIKAPSKYSPRRHPQRAKKRRNIVLQKLFSLGKISKKQADTASRTPVQVQTAHRSRRRAPYFVDYVRKELDKIIEEEHPEAQSLKIHTGLDYEYQSCAEAAVTKGLKRIEENYSRLRRAKPSLQAALVAVTPTNGDVLAWVGGRNYGKNQFDRVTMAKRQPGSAFKPFVYLTALDRHLNDYRAARTTSILEDKPISLKVAGNKTWEPQNYDKKFRGEVTVREALTKSLNVPTVNLALKVGIDKIALTASLFGFGDDLPPVPSLALGAGEVSPLEMARAYAALANGGILLNVRPILSVRNERSEELLYKAGYGERRVVSEPAVYVLTNILQSVIENGTGRVVRRMGFKRPAAGKTGTSNETRDAWFAGFTPRLLAVVWVGFDDNRKIGLTGGSAAAPIWTEFMKCTEAMEPNLDFIAPPGVVFKKIDITTGLLDVGYCPPEVVVTEVFVEGNEPITPCLKHTPRKSYGESEYEYDYRTGTHRRKPKKSLWDRIFDW